MKKENINNYYTDEDLINFEKLKNFKEFKVNKLNNIKTTFILLDMKCLIIKISIKL